MELKTFYIISSSWGSFPPGNDTIMFKFLSSPERPCSKLNYSCNEEVVYLTALSKKSEDKSLSKGPQTACLQSISASFYILSTCL